MGKRRTIRVKRRRRREKEGDFELGYHLEKKGDALRFSTH